MLLSILDKSLGTRNLGTMSRPLDLLQGTLDLLILRTLDLGPMHGWGISQRIQQVSQLRHKEIEIVGQVRSVGISAPEQVIAQGAETGMAEKFEGGVVNEVGDREAVHQHDGLPGGGVGEFVMGDALRQFNVRAAEGAPGGGVQFEGFVAVGKEHGFA